MKVANECHHHTNSIICFQSSMKTTSANREMPSFLESGENVKQEGPLAVEKSALMNFI